MAQKQPTLWKETLWYNCMRAFFAGVVWSLFLVVTGQNGVAMLIFGPIVMAVAAYPLFGITTALFMAFFGPIGILVGGFAAMFLVSVGDPFVYALSKVKPEWVPVENPAIFSPILLKRVKTPASTKRFAVIEIEG